LLIPPEAKLAIRLINSRSLTPPIDIHELIREFAELHERNFPAHLDMDGLCLGLKASRDKPKVILNTKRPKSRQRFTLAHELGHILIPWHTGDIVDYISASDDDKRYDPSHLIIESEANRFASELLLPSHWLSDQIKDFDSLSTTLKNISTLAKTQP
jgi:Zn-dependent peptidase ImmA (M78 family)